MEPSHGSGPGQEGDDLLIARKRLRDALICALALCASALAFDPGRAGFSIAYKEEHSDYRINAAFLMPGENLDLRLPTRDSGSFILIDPAARGRMLAPGHWAWQAPDSAGAYSFRIAHPASGDTMTFNAFVMVPASAMRGEMLDGYRIGKYPKTPLRGLAFYGAPKGFIRLDSASLGMPISPHFRLGQFACKQSANLPGYLALKERLVLKLELVLEKANQAGYACESFHVMSGYRTPFYNRLIGNVKLSAHQYGGAADIFIDANPVDGEMDDLNRDGRSDGEDSGLLFALVDGMSLNEFFLPYIGGIGKYSKNESHGAFVHVDVRGFRAVW